MSRTIRRSKYDSSKWKWEKQKRNIPKCFNEGKAPDGDQYNGCRCDYCVTKRERDKIKTKLDLKEQMDE